MPEPPAYRRWTRIATCAFVVAASTMGCQGVRSPEATSSRTDPAATARFRKNLRLMIEAARDRVFPALVNIHVVTVDHWGGKEHKSRATGSGTIISKDGYVVTNQHVTHRGRKFRCTLSDKREIPAELVGEDPLTDLAVLKLELSELEDSATSLPVAVFGDSASVRVGDHVMAMGSPFALARSVTLGIVSNTERVFAGGWSGDDIEEIQLESGQRTGLFTRWIQHDALIHPGNSGGPLVNLLGEVIGINELGGSAMGFSIPSNLAETVVATLIQHGEVNRSWIGVSLQPIKKTGLDRGVLVNSVVKKGPADVAGIQPGDVILRLDDEAVTARFPEEIPLLLKRISDAPIGSSISITRQRGEAIATVQVVTEKLQKDRGDEAALRAWGITVQEITEKMARDRRLDDRSGVLVSSLRSGGAAQLAEPALRSGDILRAIDGRPTSDLAALVEIYERIMDTDPVPDHVLVRFDRRGKDLVTLLKPKPDEDVDPPREVRKAWIGIATQPVLGPLASQLGHPDRLGYRIARVYPRTLAADADLAVGDVILALNGEHLKPRGMQDSGLLARKVRQLDFDRSATLTILRDEAMRDVTVALERSRRTRAEARRDRNRDFELTVREVTFFDRDDRRWDDRLRGVLVEQVESAGWAGLGGIQRGDLIQEIDGHRVRGLKSYRSAMESATQAQGRRVIFVVLRGVRTRFQYVEPDWKPVLADKGKEETHVD